MATTQEDAAAASAAGEALGGGGGGDDGLAWAQALEALEARLGAARGAMRDVLAGHQPEYEGTFACCAEVTAALRALRTDVRAAAASASAADGVAGVAQHAREQQARATDRAARLEALVDGLEQVRGVQVALEELDAALAQTALQRAAEQCAAVELQLDDLVQRHKDLADARVHRAARVQLRRKKARLRAAAEEDVASCLQVSRNSVEIKLARGEAQLANAFRALDTAGALRGLLGTVAHNLLDDMLLPLAERPSTEVKTHLSESAYTLVLCTADGEDTEEVGTAAAAERVFENVVHVLEFFHKYVLDSNADWMGYLAQTLWGSLDAARLKKETQERLFKGSSSSLTSSSSSSSSSMAERGERAASLAEALLRVLVDALPQDVAGLPLYQALGAVARAAEGTLHELGLVPDAAFVLGPFLDNAEGYLAQKRRAALLHRARERIVGDYLSSELVEGAADDSSLRKDDLRAAVDSGACGDLFRQQGPVRVTRCALDVCGLAEEAMQEAAAGAARSPQLALVLYQTCRDLFELFRMLVPLAHGAALGSADSARPALLFHNDCMHMARRLLFLGHEFRRKLPAEVGEQVLTVDMVPFFRETAAEHLQRQVVLQVERIEALCLGTAKAAEAAPQDLGPVDDMMHRLALCGKSFAELEREWQAMLSPQAYAQVLPVLANDLLGRCVAFVTTEQPPRDAPLSPGDILSVRQALQGLQEDVSAQLVQRVHERLHKAVPNLLALSQLAEVLEQFLSMHIFRDMVTAGNLSALSQAQVHGLAAFLFPGEAFDD